MHRLTAIFKLCFAQASLKCLFQRRAGPVTKAQNIKSFQQLKADWFFRVIYLLLSPRCLKMAHKKRSFSAPLYTRSTQKTYLLPDTKPM